MRYCDFSTRWGARNKEKLARKSLVLLFAFLAISALIITAACGGTSGSTSTNSGNGSGSTATAKVMIVVEENKGYDDVINNPAMPYLNSLATQYGLATNYYANDQPSLPNYFMMTTGQTVVSHTDEFTGVFSGDNVVRILTGAGKTWKVYAENLPSVGYMGGDQFPYVQHHVPFVLFSDVQGSPSQQQNVVPLSQLSTDLANGTLPDYSFVVPNDYNNSHDCPAGMATCTRDQTLANADTWLKTNIDPVLKNSDFQQNGLLIVTYDEATGADKTNGGGHIATVLAGPRVKSGYRSNTMFQHQSLLRMSLEYLGINQFPGAAANAPSMTEFVK